VTATTHPAEDADAAAQEIHQRAADDYAANAPYRQDQAKQAGDR
jgi:hypothetical protein